jgi:hypothetical protein
MIWKRSETEVDAVAWPRTAPLAADRRQTRAEANVRSSVPITAAEERTRFAGGRAR